MSGVTVTPTGVREGDPAALAALCAVRGPSVVAYCRHVAGEADAGAAAAEAFARFRVAVVNAGDTSELNPEALLVSATRTSAAAHAQTTAPGHCAAVPALLAARAEKTIAPADLERLAAHLEECWTCRAPVARFKAAERAYRDPPEKTVEPELTAQIVGALIAAVPPPAPPPPEAAPASANGSAAHASVAAGSVAPDAPAEPPSASVAAGSVAPDAPAEPPTEHLAAPDALDPEPADGAADADAAAATTRRRRRPRPPSGAGALLARLRPGSRPRGPGRQPQGRESDMPREPRLVAVSPRRAKRSRGRRPLALVLPIILVLLALVAALYVSGVFGGNDPESSPSVVVPAAEPVDATKSEIVEVPGAKDATADAVEDAKARARGETPESEPAKQDAAKADDDTPAKAPSPPPPPPPAAANPPPAAPAAPAVSENHPAQKPAPKAAPKPEKKPSEETGLEADGGATGAEQLPPPADASDVPALAPPPQP